ncbi:MAG: hypothetical protein P8046_10020 [Anaerolineales bacterium]
MTALQVTLLVFAGIEALSVLELYFMQDRCMFNGMALFSGWEISKEVPEVHGMVCYLINWVAGMKLIVVGLLVILVLMAPTQILLLVGASLFVTVASFFWRMFPLVSKFDANGFIQPAGRAKTMGLMVAGLEVLLIGAVIIEAVLYLS